MSIINLNTASDRTAGPATGVVFAGRNGLDFLELRVGAVRIPEVSLRIKEAQAVLDRLDVESIDLMGSLVIEDDAFFRNIKVKSLLASIVQVGLYDRLKRTQRAPEIFVGNSNGDSALLVCAGQMTLEQLVTSSDALSTLRPRASQEAVSMGAKVVDAVSAPGLSAGLLPMGLSPGLLPIPAMQAPLHTNNVSNVTHLPSLSGMSITEYRAFVRIEDGGMVEIGQASMDLKKLLAEVVEHQGVQRFINVGPGAALPSAEYEHVAEIAGSDEVTVIDSIDLDPMLNWFWKQVRPAAGFAQ